MVRPNKQTDIRLLQAGRKILLEQGLDNLTVSAICKVAKVNQGMFVYNFKNKNLFLNKLLNSLLSDLLKDLVIENPEEKKPIERMEFGLIFCCMAAVKYPQLFIQFNRATVSSPEKEKQTMSRFFLRRCNRELRRVFRFFPLAQADGDISKNISLAEFLAIVWSSLIYSCVAMHAIMDIIPSNFHENPDKYLTQEAIRCRVRKLLRFFHPDVYDTI